VLAVISGVICLVVAGPAVRAEGTFDGAYTGKRLLTKGPVPPCLVEEDVSVTIHGGTLTFTDSQLQNFVIGFDPRPDGSFSQISAGIEGSVVAIRGRIIGDALEADVANDTCTHHWHLGKEHRGL
jgi:hypothetical protein